MIHIPGLTPPFTYYGGKVRIAKWIIEHFPAHDLYVEPFGGAAAVLLAKPPSKNEIYNDLRSDIVNFYQVLRDDEQREKLKTMIKYTPYSREVFYSVRKSYYAPGCELERAWRFWVLATQCFGGGISQISRSSFSNDPSKARAEDYSAKGDMGFGAEYAAGGRGASKLTLSNNNSNIDPHAAYRQAVEEDYSTLSIGFRPRYSNVSQSTGDRMLSSESRLDLIALRLKNVLIENQDALKLMRAADRPYALFYLDPPYHDDTCDARYEHNIDHEEFLDLCLSLKGKAIISGYYHTSYDRLLEHGWRIEKMSVMALAANPNKSKSETRGERVECLWISPNCEVKEPELF